MWTDGVEEIAVRRSKPVLAYPLGDPPAAGQARLIAPDPLKDWIGSCRKLRAALPNDVLVLPAHNEPFHGLHERLDHLVDGHERSLARLLQRLRQEPRRAVDLFDVLFARPIGPDLLGLATGEAIAHVNCLVGRGLARAVKDEAGVVRYAPA